MLASECSGKVHMRAMETKVIGFDKERLSAAVYQMLFLVGFVLL